MRWLVLQGLQVAHEECNEEEGGREDEYQFRGRY
jgi:hypothetical protein